MDYVCILCMLFIVPSTAAALWQTLFLHYGEHIAKLQDAIAEHVAARPISGYYKMPVFVVSH